MEYYEVNFDGLPGPTHLYGGLSADNLASKENKDLLSNPRLAALQSLEKIKFLADKGFKQAILPPHPRPNYDFLELQGYQGSKLEKIRNAAAQDPEIIQVVMSSSFMWTANAATYTPGLDNEAGENCLTTANLITNIHRSTEAFHTYKIFRNIFENTDIKLFPPLPATVGDEGAANHIRFAEEHGCKGLELFVYSYSIGLDIAAPEHFDGRQCLEASMAVIEAHELTEDKVVLAQQNPASIDAGVFHNDVISTGNLNFFIVHEFAFVNQELVIQELKEKYKNITGADLICHEVADSDLSLEEAVDSYFFNSQILGSKDHMLWIAPSECKENKKVSSYINKLIEDQANPIKEVYYIDLKQSMLNGGGPACLRLRMVLSEEQIKNSRQEVFYTEKLYKNLKACIKEFYPDKLSILDVLEAEKLEVFDKAYQELNGIFGAIIFSE